MNTNLVSVVIPVFNAENYIVDSIKSVLNQDYKNIEIIVINDGSTDSSDEMIRSIKDSRMHYISQKNKGVSAARNKGLSIISGNYFCFLDADDLMSSSSISNRLNVFFQNDDLAFVGGGQEQWNEDLSQLIKKQIPDYKGWAREELIKMNPKCFINCGTWLIRRERDRKYHFQEGWTHCEDLAFFLSISDQGKLDFTTKIVQIYRRHYSTMSNLNGLMDGYRKYIQYVEDNGYANHKLLNKLIKRVKRVMFLSFLRKFNLKMALESLLLTK